MPLKSIGWVYPKNAVTMVHLNNVHGNKIANELADGTLEVVHKSWNTHFQRGFMYVSLFIEKEISSDLVPEPHPRPIVG